MRFGNLLGFENPGRSELKVFASDVQNFLEDVLYEYKEFNVLWEGNVGLLDMAKSAFRSQEMVDGITDLYTAIDRIEPAVMTRHGLQGDNLRFKFGVLAHISNEFSQRATARFSVRGWFQRIVAAIDALLDSLIAAAGGAGGLIKEFKDALGALAIATS